MGYVATKSRPRYLDTDLKAEFAGDNPDYFDVKTNKWYSTSGGVSIGATLTIGSEITPRNYLNNMVYADHNGQPEYVEEVAKVEYKDSMKLNKLSVTEGFDLGQTWQNMASQRVTGVTYTNTTGKPIYISIQGSGTDGLIYITINGVPTIFNHEGSGTDTPMNAIIPNDATYSYSGKGYRWFELR